jgi:pectate lyase
LLAADFDDGSLDGWLAQDFSEGPAGPASWQASGGALLQRGDALGLPDPGGAYLLAGDPGWGDYSVRAQAFAAQPTSLGLVGRTSEQGYYRARLEAGPAESLLVLEVVLDNQVRELARTLAPATTGRWLDLELSLRGQSLSVSLDGATLLSASDTTLHVGKIGLYATADALARFDNLLVVE